MSMGRLGVGSDLALDCQVLNQIRTVLDGCSVYHKEPVSRVEITEEAAWLRLCAKVAETQIDLAEGEKRT
ncbi:hypothetical protein TYRP_021146 [Tyrophagus putrescentiae]|nr:hypothetical protein TYRP_022846 [Tyrophagus putrescentiae]KAH9394019.1 hypothetical protein TYRP_021146 [Tyrophagus putrescentiae]